MNPLNLINREFELEPGEYVIQTVRIHWFFFLVQLLPYAVLAVLPFGIPYALSLAGPVIAPYISFVGFSSPLARATLGTWWLIVWGGAFSVFTRYFLNAWIVTNQRIVEVVQKSFFNRQVSSLRLDRIEDITIDTSGVMDSLLHIGDINVQTAGTIDRFTMDNIPSPEKLRDDILAQTAARTPAPAP